MFMYTSNIVNRLEIQSAVSKTYDNRGRFYSFMNTYFIILWMLTADHNCAILKWYFSFMQSGGEVDLTLHWIVWASPSKALPNIIDWSISFATFTRLPT